MSPPKGVIYEALVEGKLEAPKHPARKGARPVFWAEIRRVFGRGPSGVFPTHLHPRSRNSSRFHNSKRRRNWVNSWLRHRLLFGFDLLAHQQSCRWTSCYFH